MKINKINLFQIVSVILLAFCMLLSCPINSMDIYYYGEPKADPTDTIHVFLIGVDGWGSYSLPKADMPAVKSMMEEGSYTLNTMNVIPTASMPNWASMLYGTTPAFHGFTHNTVIPTFPQVIVDEYGYFPNIFALIKKKVPDCQVAALSGYDDIIKIVPSDVLDKAKEVPNIKDITDYIAAIDPGRPSFTFIQFDEVDGVGHRSGHNSSEYYEALIQVDKDIAKIKQSVIDAGIENDTIFILSADHGGFFYALNSDYMGMFYQHGGDTPEERQIPLIFYGKNIRRGFGITSSANIYDIAPTIASFFGIDIPYVWIGRSIREVLY
jgi:predicted AlkP superfamily pyrophosphatase or phosphodiesterase